MKKMQNLTEIISKPVTSNQKCKFVTKYRQNGKIYSYTNFKCYIDTQ